MMKVVSWFSRLLHHLPRAKLSHLVVKHQAERRRRDLPAGPNCWQCSFVTWPVPTLRSFLKRSNSNLKVKTFIGTRENAPTHSDLDSPDCFAAAQIPAPSLPIWLVFVKPGDDAAPQSLYLSGSDDLVTRYLRPTAFATGNPVPAIRFWTEGCRDKMKKGNLVLGN